MTVLAPSTKPPWWGLNRPSSTAVGTLKEPTRKFMKPSLSTNYQLWIRRQSEASALKMKWRKTDLSWLLSACLDLASQGWASSIESSYPLLAAKQSHIGTKHNFIPSSWTIWPVTWHWQGKRSGFRSALDFHSMRVYKYTSSSVRGINASPRNNCPNIRPTCKNSSIARIKRKS